MQEVTALRVLLLDAAHHHAEVHGLDDHADAARLDRLLDGLRDLDGEALLDLEAARVDVDEARDLGEADDLAVRQVGDVGLAEEGQQVVLAELSRRRCP